jgi:hypothetical protein
MRATGRAQSFEHGRGAGRVLGFPLEGFSLFQSLLLSFATAFFTFFVATFLAIVSLLVWRLSGHLGVDFTITYRDVGFPAGVLALVVALPYFGYLWVRSRTRS